jgi:diketogulonate reductase-like aldo/keto reductase
MANKYIGISCESFGPVSNSAEHAETSYNMLRKTIMYSLKQLTSNQMIMLITSPLYSFVRGCNEVLVGKVLLDLTENQRKKIIIIIKGGLIKLPLEHETECRYLEPKPDNNDCYEGKIELDESFAISKKNLQVELNIGITLGYILYRCSHVKDTFIDQMKFLKKIKDTKQVTKIGLCEIGMDHLSNAYHILDSLDFVELEFSPNVKYLLKKKNAFILTKEWCNGANLHIIATNTLYNGFWSRCRFEENEKLDGSLQNMKVLSKSFSTTVCELVIGWVSSLGITPLIESYSFADSVKHIDALNLTISNKDQKRIDLLTCDLYDVWKMPRC